MLLRRIAPHACALFRAAGQQEYHGAVRGSSRWEVKSLISSRFSQVYANKSSFLLHFL
jgi:hypothetical protein